MNLYLGIQIAPYRIDFCNALAEEYGYAVFHLEKTVDLGFSQSWVAEQLRFEDRRYPEPRLNVRTWRYFRALLRQFSPEIVLVSEFSLTTLWMLLFSRLGPKRFRVVSLCDDSMDMIQGNDFTLGHRLARRIIPRFLDNLVLSSKETAEWYRNRFGKGVWMPIVADDRRFRTMLEASLPEARRLAGQLDIQGRRVVLFVGRHVAVKNVDMLIRSFADCDVPARLLVVGDGPCRKEWESLAGSLEADVVFVGSKSGEELAAYYQLADLFVLPSTVEPFGAVVNEALLAGVPVLVSARAGSRVLVHSGNGRIVEPVPEEMTAALASMLQAVPVRTEYGMRPDLMTTSFREWLSDAMRSL